MKMIAGYMNNSTLNNDCGVDDGDDDVCHCLFYTNLSSVVRKLSTAAKAFLPHRSGGRRLDNGQTERNLLLHKIEIEEHWRAIGKCIFQLSSTQRKDDNLGRNSNGKASSKRGREEKAKSLAIISLFPFRTPNQYILTLFLSVVEFQK